MSIFYQTKFLICDKADCFHAPINWVFHKSLVIIGDMHFFHIAVFGYSLNYIFLNQSFGQFKLCLYQRIVTRHIMIITVQVAVKNKSDSAYFRIVIKMIFDNVVFIACPEIFLTSVNSVSDYFL